MTTGVFVILLATRSKADLIGCTVSACHCGEAVCLSLGIDDYDTGQRLCAHVVCTRLQTNQKEKKS